MLVKWGGLVASGSGSIGGIVASRNRGGAYFRTRTIPINPGSARQQTVRFAVAQLSTRWVDTLTADQRAAWEAYAAAVPLLNPLGEPRNVGGIAMYVRSNAPRLSFPGSALTVVDDAPTIFDIGSYTEPELVGASEAAQTLSWSFENTDAWAIAVGGAMFVYASRPVNPSIKYFKGPYQPADVVEGAVVPPTSPAAMALPFPVVEDQKIFCRCNVCFPDGRLASSFRADVIVST